MFSLSQNEPLISREKALPPCFYSLTYKTLTLDGTLHVVGVFVTTVEKVFVFAAVKVLLSPAHCTFKYFWNKKRNELGGVGCTPVKWVLHITTSKR